MRVIIEEISPSEEEVIIIRCEKLTARQMRAIEVLRSSEYLIAYAGTEIFRIPLEDIYYCEVVDKKTFAYCNYKVYEVKKKFSELEEMLEERFVRISRTFLLNWEKIVSLKPLLNGRLEARLENEEHIIISRQYVNALKEKFGT